MGLFGWIVMGLIVGSIAQSVVGVEKRGCLFTILVGVLGAVIGGALFNSVSNTKRTMEFNLGSMFVAFVGAGLLCLVLRVLQRPARRR
jgi:uncharacterized membrane protein YeaQ/YmgE (transglycosylase-associated protein family)